MAISLSKDGRRALVGGGNVVHLWDLLTSDDLEKTDHEKAVRRVVFSSNERQVVSVMDDGIRVSTLSPGPPDGDRPAVVAVRQYFPQNWQIHDTAAVSPFDGRWILTCGFPGGVRPWERETGKFLDSFNDIGFVTNAVAFSPRKRILALTGGDDGIVRHWDLETREHRDLGRHRDIILCVAFSADGKLGYSAGGILSGFREGSDFAVRVWDTESGRELAPFEGHKGSIWSVAVSRDGRYLLSGGTDSVPIVWDVSTRRLIHRLQAHTATVRSVAFLPNSTRAVSASDDGTIRLWDVETGREIPDHFKNLTTDDRHVAISPDGTRMFSACATWAPLLEPRNGQGDSGDQMGRIANEGLVYAGWPACGVGRVGWHRENVCAEGYRGAGERRAAAGGEVEEVIVRRLL